MISDQTQHFIRTMAARGAVVFPAARQPVEVIGGMSRKDHAEGCRLRAERKRRAAGCRVYRQPFKGQLPDRSDPTYKTVYMRLVRAAKKGKQL